MINLKRNKEKTKEELIIENQENTISNFEDKMAKLKAIFQVNNYGNNKLMLDKIREIIYE
jgi:molybdopterin converting factor small subunit